MTRAELRAQVFHRADNVCEWPSCYQYAEELAHLHSIGAGGRKSADTTDNAIAACSDHSRITDGEYGSGGAKQYRHAHLELMGARYLEMDAGVIAFERAETLRALIGETT